MCECDCVCVVVDGNNKEYRPLERSVMMLLPFIVTAVSVVLPLACVCWGKLLVYC